MLRMSSLLLQDLLKKNVSMRMRDPTAVETKLAAMIEAGVDRLLVISDFDHTLSRHSMDGQPCSTTHGALEAAMKEIDIEAYNQSRLMCEKYMKVEFCPLLSVEEKIPHMEAWWDETHKLTIRARFSKHKLEEFTAMSGIRLRERVPEFMAAVDECRVPLVLFSAGVGNIIEWVLKHQLERVPASLHLIANRMDFNEEGICTRFLEPLIHTFNKNSSVIRQEPEFFRKIADRGYVLLLGDSLGDTHMDVGVEREAVVLKIGFLNFNHQTLLEKYLNAYDILLVDDHSFEVPLTILNQIRGITSE